MQASIQEDSLGLTGQQISAAVANGVRAPLAALRASMESLAGAFSAGDPRSLAVRGALGEVVRLGHEMQALLDFALPQSPKPLSCSLREIVYSALDGLSPEKRASVLVAVEDRRARLAVDGPLLSRSIARLLDSAWADPRSPALLRARVDGGEAVFTLVLGAACAPDDDTTFIPFHSAVSVFGAALAKRDVERMGGRLSVPAAAGAGVVSEIRFPREPSVQEGRG